MAEAVAWAAALQRCGLNAPSIQFLRTDGGVDSIVTLRAVGLADIKDMMNSIRRSAERAPVLAGAPRPSFSFVVGLKIKAFRMWIEYRDEKNQTPTAGAYDNAAIARWTARLTEIQNLESSAAAQSIPEPPKLASFTGWETWLELFTTYLSHVRSPTLKIPFTYLTRPAHEGWDDMTPAQRTAILDAAATESVDDDLIQTARHTGTNFTVDNRVLFDLLKTLTIEGTCWTFIERFNASRNGRSAFLILQKQAEGDWAVTSKRTDAYASITNAHFSGKGRFTLAQYTAVHNSAHNKLEATQEPVPETKKVTDYLNGINCDLLKTSKQIVLSDIRYKTSFQDCQQYMQSVWSDLSGTDKKGNRNISQVDIDPRQHKKRFPNRGPRNPRPNQKKQKQGRHYTSAEWAKLKAEGKTKAIEEGRKKKTSERLAREASAVVTSPTLDAAAIVAAVTAALQSTGVSIGSVRSTQDDDTALSALTTSTPKKGDTTTTLALPLAAPIAAPPASNKESAPLITKKNQTPGDFAAARQASAGGQFGRKHHTKEVSFPSSIVNGASGKPKATPMGQPVTAKETKTVGAVSTTHQKPNSLVLNSEHPLGHDPPSAALRQRNIQKDETIESSYRLTRSNVQFGLSSHRWTAPCIPGAGFDTREEAEQAVKKTRKVLDKQPIQYTTKAIPGIFFPTLQAAKDAIKAWKKKKTKKSSPRKAMVLPTQKNKRPIAPASSGDPSDASTVSAETIVEGEVNKRFKRDD
jgi:hypothetical protein